MSVSPEKPIDDGPAMIYRTINDVREQLSPNAQECLQAVFDGTKIIIAKHKDFLSLLETSPHKGDGILYKALQEIDFISYETKKKSIKLKSEPDIRHISHSKIQAEFSRVPLTFSEPKEYSTPKIKTEKKAGKTEVKTCKVTTLLAKLREASQRREAVRNKVRMPPKVA